MVSTAAQARTIVNLSKFPPLGSRGQGSPFACFEHGLATPAEYVQKGNESLVIMAQIETAEGLKNIEEICQVDGIGMCLRMFNCDAEMLTDMRQRLGTDRPE